MENLLNLQIIFERLLDSGVEAVLVPSPDMPGLRGLCFYEGATEPEDPLIICVKGHGDALPEKGSLLLIGDWREDELRGLKGYIHVLSCSPFQLVNILERIFSYYKDLEIRLLKALSAGNSIQEISLLAVEHFGEPVFVHDENFYILSCPKAVPGMADFDYDNHIKAYMQDEKTLLNFQTSAAYQETLTNRGGQIWVSDFNDDKCLYVNIWDDQVYKGRLVVQERRGTAGKLREVGYFGEILRQAIVSSAAYRNNAPDPLKEILIDAINGEQQSPELMIQRAELVGWKADDAYVCGMAAFIGRGVMSQYLVSSVCNSIEKQIQGSRSFYYSGAIYTIVNLTEGGITLNELRMQMSYTIREYMLHIGVSDMFCHIQELPIHWKQAEVALLYSLGDKRTNWYREFRENALQYWLIHGLGKLTREGIIAAELNLLKDYDRKNGSELYQTLKVYLMEERNSTITTQLLKIHRSTLPYRLKRIEELTGLNLDDFRTRMYLLMSFTAEDGELVSMQGEPIV